MELNKLLIGLVTMSMLMSTCGATVVGNVIKLEGVAEGDMGFDEYLKIKDTYKYNPTAQIYINGVLMDAQGFEEYFMENRYDTHWRKGYMVKENDDKDYSAVTINDRVDTLEDEVAKIKDRLDGHDDVLADHEDRITQNEGDIADLQDDVNDLREKNVEQDERLDNVEEQADRNTKKIRSDRRNNGNKFEVIDGRLTEIENEAQDGSAKFEAFIAAQAERDNTQDIVVREAIEQQVEINAELEEAIETIELIPGPAGKDGVDGKDGKDGKRGKKGDTGPQGEQGEVGPVGPQGEDGYSLPEEVQDTINWVLSWFGY